MKTENFWVMDSYYSSDSALAANLASWQPGEVQTGEPIVCPIDQGHQRGSGRISDLSLIIPGRRVKDFVWTWYGECLIQDRVLEIFQANSLTGYTVKPVKARFKRNVTNEPAQLHELVVIGKGGMAPPESGVRLIEHCEACGLVRYSKWNNPQNFIDFAQWDGSDFFRVQNLGSFVTDRVYRVVLDNKFTGVKVFSVQEYFETIKKSNLLD